MFVPFVSLLLLIQLIDDTVLGDRDFRNPNQTRIYIFATRSNNRLAIKGAVRENNYNQRSNLVNLSYRFFKQFLREVNVLILNNLSPFFK